MTRRAAAAAAALAAVGATVVYCRRRAAAGRAGPVGVTLESWIPAPPVHPLARILAYLWAAPISVAGLLAGLASGAVPRLRHGVLLFAPARGLTGAVVRRRGFAAAGLGHVVIALNEPSDELMAHELVHVRQAERLGPFMAPAYLVLLAVHGYRDHPMERAARLAAAR